MNILHIAKITKDMTNGVNAVVPQYVLTQNKFANVKLVNIANIKANLSEDMQLAYQGNRQFIFNNLLLNVLITKGVEIRKNIIGYNPGLYEAAK